MAHFMTSLLSVMTSCQIPRQSIQENIVLKYQLMPTTTLPEKKHFENTDRQIDRQTDRTTDSQTDTSSPANQWFVGIRRM